MLGLLLFIAIKCAQEYLLTNSYTFIGITTK